MTEYLWDEDRERLARGYAEEESEQLRRWIDGAGEKAKAVTVGEGEGGR